MDSLARLLLRFVLVPLGYFAAVVVATLVIVLGSWKLGAAAAHPDTQAFAIFGFVFAAPVLLIMLLSLMWLPAAIGILISEAFAIRSFMFHAGNGVTERHQQEAQQQPPEVVHLNPSSPWRATRGVRGRRASRSRSSIARRPPGCRARAACAPARHSRH